mmetsp:Transcript_5850/g.11064  ORF Transcript_5850/g.11064 Transcript_5850/m.11064 type:complete len:239 (-) Transcript_5850:444-1160(-)
MTQIKALLLLLLLPLSTFAKRPSSHPHDGVLGAHLPGLPEGVTLSKDDERDLNNGKAVMKQIPNPDPNVQGGSALCVQDISSPSSDVWSQILGFDKYVGKVPKLKECKVYETKDEEDGKTIKVCMKIGILPGYSYTCYYSHRLHRPLSSLTWSLDYSKYSDFDDVQGHWHLHPTSEKTTRVFYTADLKLRGKVPGPVMNFLGKKALKEATGWVKRESEKATKERDQAGAAYPDGALPQ